MNSVKDSVDYDGFLESLGSDTLYIVAKTLDPIAHFTSKVLLDMDEAAEQSPEQQLQVIDNILSRLAAEPAEEEEVASRGTTDLEL